jgi:hypothetical protein
MNVYPIGLPLAKNMIIGDMMYKNRYRVSLRLIGTVYENAIELMLIPFGSLHYFCSLQIYEVQ